MCAGTFDTKSNLLCGRIIKYKSVLVKIRDIQQTKILLGIYENSHTIIINTELLILQYRQTRFLESFLHDLHKNT